MMHLKVKVQELEFTLMMESRMVLIIGLWIVIMVYNLSGMFPSMVGMLDLILLGMKQELWALQS